jgi:ElaB/YqjD/DUF883 family membrane-anchored ribosome-binding protein
MNTQVKKDLEDALLLLNRAAKEETKELQEMIHEKYDAVREMFGEKIAQGTETAKKTMENVDKKVRANPWPYLATAAMGAFLLGLFLRKGRER